MTDDPTRSTARPDLPQYGRVGPVDPHTDPATRPAMIPGGDPGPISESERPTARAPLAERPADPPTGPTVPTAPTAAPALKHSRSGGLWTGLILSAIVLIFLLVFILQNSALVQINFLGFSGSLPTGAALLFAAIAGLLLVAIPGGLRILQLRRAARRGPR
jgi:uncharacterized integral membrane protein